MLDGDDKGDKAEIKQEDDDDDKKKPNKAGSSDDVDNLDDSND